MGFSSSSNIVFQEYYSKYHDKSKKTRNNEINYFNYLGRGYITSECPIKKTVLFKESGDITSESFNSKSFSKESENEEEEILEGDLFTIRKMFEGVAKGNEGIQRENIFHFRCCVREKVCSLAIDGGSCTNVVSIKLVTKMNLETKPRLLDHINYNG